MCVMIALAVLSFAGATSTYKKSHFTWLLFLPLTCFILVKLIISRLIYSKIKYKDDARENVSFFDFLTIHVTFAMMNAWITYYIFELLELTIASSCPSNLFTLLQDDSYPKFCYKDIHAYTDIKQREIYFYNLLVLPSKILFCIIFLEMSIYVAYYKDGIFATMTLVNYLGMLLVAYQ